MKERRRERLSLLTSIRHLNDIIVTRIDTSLCVKTCIQNRGIHRNLARIRDGRGIEGGDTSARSGKSGDTLVMRFVPATVISNV